MVWGMALGVALGLAVALGAFASTGHLLRFDPAVSDALQDTPAGEFFDRFADVPAYDLIEMAVLAVAAAYAWWRGARVLAVSVLLAGGALVLNDPLKELIARPRPGSANVIVRDPVSGYGYPSGHAMSSVLVYGYAGCVAAICAPRRLAWAVVGGVAVVIAAVGWDRVYDGAHWSSDVLGGWVTGAALLLLAIGPATIAPVLVRAWRPRDAAVGQSKVGGLG